MSRRPTRFAWSLRNPALRGWILQILTIVGLAVATYYLMHNTLENIRARGMQSGFDFIVQPAGFSIGESIIAFDPADSYGKAYLAGLANTLRVALGGLVLATLIGTVVGIGRLSGNLLVRALSTCYVEIVRSVPVLLQLLIWYFVLTELLPTTDAALHPLAGTYLSNSGLQYPLPRWTVAHWGTIAGFIVGVLTAYLWSRYARHRRACSGHSVPTLLPGVAFALSGAVLGWWVMGAPVDLDIPERTAVSIVGGGSVTPEFLAILIGLSVYFASFIAEIVRAGIQSVPRGQREACSAIGLTRMQTLRLVIMPQAMRVIVPPLTSQYVNLVKNSSLAVAVGYPDLVSISATSLNQTGRAIECIGLMVACFLTLSLITSALMARYNHRTRFKDRQNG